MILSPGNKRFTNFNKSVIKLPRKPIAFVLLLVALNHIPWQGEPTCAKKDDITEMRNQVGEA